MPGIITALMAMTRSGAAQEPGVVPQVASARRAGDAGVIR